jgi:hypothetical protein
MSTGSSSADALLALSKALRRPLLSEPPRYHPNCFLAHRGAYERSQMPSCDGRLVKCHLIPRHLLRHTDGVLDLWDPATYVWACGGPMGNTGHHGLFDGSRTIRLPRSAIPQSTENYAQTFGLEWYLDRTYGPKC